MKHFQTDHKGDYRYRTPQDENGLCVQIDITYSRNNRRGYFLHINAMTIKDGMMSFEIFQGAHCFLAATERKSVKSMRAIAERLDPIVTELAAIFAQDKAAAVALATTRMAA